MSNETKQVCCVDVSKSYHDGENDITVLNHMNLTVEAGESLAVVGPSGSGKSTLLHLLGGLDRPTTGEVFLHGQNWHQLSEDARCKWRNKHVGFVYQFHHLLPEFTALENVMMPLIIGNQSEDEARSTAKAMLDEVGLSTRMHHKPMQLSGGERQRVAIARALGPKPDCMLADEPTGNLDRTTAAQVFDIMLELNQTRKMTLIVVTHDLSLAERLGQVLDLEQKA